MFDINKFQAGYSKFGDKLYKYTGKHPIDRVLCRDREVLMQSNKNGASYFVWQNGHISKYQNNINMVFDPQFLNLKIKFKKIDRLFINRKLEAAKNSPNPDINLVNDLRMKIFNISEKINKMKWQKF